MSVQSANKRIAINTAYLYIRLFVTMAIGLYTSRLVLLILGVSNYGLFSVVASVLTMFTFISGSLGTATSRFFNIEMGKKDGDVNRSFNINLILHISLAAIVIILAETVGLWYVYNKLNVEPGKLGDAVFIYQISIITSCLGIINGPYGSLIIAHEKFKFTVTVDIVNNIIRLICVILLQYYQGDALRPYAIIMSFTTVNNFVLYHIKAARDWPKIVKYRFVRGWKYYKDVLVFSNWNLFATMAMVARGTGSNLLINAFFNTAVNGAFAISNTVNQYVSNFSTNFDSASGPQIMQSYSGNDSVRCNYLVCKMGKFNLLLFELVFFPLYIELNFVLELWLKVVPPDVLTFCRLNLILAAIALTCGGIVQYINASGKIKWFKINASFFFLLCIPVGYLLFKNGAPAYTMIVLFLIADALQRIVQLILMRYILKFDSWNYVREAYIPPFIIAAVMSVILWLHSMLPITSDILRLLSIFVCFIITGLLIYIIGLKKGEKTTVLNNIKSKLHIKK